MLRGATIPETRISHIVGKAATDPIMKKDPKNPRNRRISIVLLRGSVKNKNSPSLNQSKSQNLQDDAVPAGINNAILPNAAAPPYFNDVFHEQ